MLEEIRKRWEKKYTTFATKNNGIATVDISNTSEVGDSFATIKVEIREWNPTSGETRTIVPVGMPPVKQAGDLLRLGNTFYTLTNGLIQRDGFFLVKDKDYVALEFIRRDKVLFRFQDSKEKVKLVVVGNSSKIDTCGFLMGLDVFDSRDEFNYYMADIKHLFAKTNITSNKESIARTLFYTMYGPAQTESYIEILNEKTFNGFFGTTEEYKGKPVFFSYSRFIGCHLSHCDEDAIPSDTIIDDSVALMMDRAKVKNACIVFEEGIEEQVSVDWSSNFTEQDLVNALRLMVLKIKYPEKVASCDTYALYNKELYTYYDYVTDYIYDRVCEYVKFSMSNSAYAPMSKDHIHERDFKQWIRKGSTNTDDMEKGLSIVSANNSVTFAMNRNKFTKDLMRKNIDTIKDEDRYLHQSYFGWVNPFITSDSKKVGLTGSFIDAVDMASFSRPFKVLSARMTEEKQTEPDDEMSAVINSELTVDETHMTPLDTYNKVIGIIEKDGSEITMLNGKIMDTWGKDTWDIYCEVHTLEDMVSNMVPGLECDQPKRYRLSNKAIIQSLPMCATAEFPRRGVRNPHEDDYIGKSVMGILQDLAATYPQVATLIKTRGEAAGRSFQVLSVTIGKYTQLNDNTSYEYDDKQDDTYYLTLLIDGIEYLYRHPRYIQSPAENTRLYFYINRPANGTYYTSNEVVITSGKVGEVGQECNIMYSSLDGYAYEDGIILTTAFIKKMGLTTKLHFTQTVPFEGELQDVLVKRVGDIAHLDEKGLPKLGTFIRKGDILCKIFTPAPKMEISSFSGFVECVKVNRTDKDIKKEIKIYLTDIRVPTVGDKLGNGHGNKGVTVKEVSSEHLCVTGDTQPDIIINPLGTLARMNLGQIKEMMENIISINSETRIDLQTSGFDQKDIKSLYLEMKDKGIYKEEHVIYNGTTLGETVFIAPMTMYRMKQHSQVHMKSSSRPDLNVNHIASNGQRMSVLNTTLYSAYGCQEALKYLLSYQSRTSKNSADAERSLLEDIHVKPEPRLDTSILRANAMHLARGQRLANDGPAILTASEVATLQVLGSQENALVNKFIFGEANPRRLSGYNAVAKIKVGGPVIMPSILFMLCSLIPYKFMYNGKNLDVNMLNKKMVEQICHYNKSRLYLNLNYDNSCINLYDGVPKNTSLIDTDLSQGYFTLIECIRNLDIDAMRKHISEEAQAQLDEYTKVYGKDLFQKVILDGVPIAPVNLRPTYKGLSGQSVDSLYRNLSRASSPLSVFDSLVAIDREFGVQLYQHNKVVAKRGEIAHGEKTSEYIDSIYARRYGYSGRSVATFDTSLDIFEISLPFELFYYELENIIKNYIFKGFIDALREDREEETLDNATHKTQLFHQIDETIKGFISNTKYDHDLFNEILNTMARFANRIATGMTREPTLRRQNHFWYTITFHKGSSIKVHPAICSGYNLDFDGDAVAQFLCLSHYYSYMLLNKMSPFEGIYDYDSGEIWLKPVQDSLLGLYKITKYAPAEEAVRIYTNTEDNQLERIKLDVKLGYISLGDTIIYIKGEHHFIKETVGNIILLLTIRNDALLDNEEFIAPILSSIHGGMTNKNNGKFIETLLQCEQLFAQEYWDLKSSVFFDLDKFRKLRVIRDVINLGYEFMTITGVTLKPSTFGNIRTAEEVRKELGYNTTNEFNCSEPILQRLRSNVPPLYSISSLNGMEQDVRDVISSDIMRDEGLSDIFKSGCRGKIDDFMKVCDSIGDNIYEGSARFIKSNYSKGLSYIDKMLLAQPDRKAVVNTQVHLGEQGAVLSRSAIVASGSRVMEERCSTKPTQFYPEYDVFMDGMRFSSQGIIPIEDAEILQTLEQLVPPEDAAKYKGYPAELVSKVLVKLGKSEFNGKPLTYALTPVDKGIISQHYVEIGGQEYPGNTMIEFIEKEHPKTVGIYTLYNCKTTDGICKHCYGIVPNEKIMDSFSGNVGINVVFSVGQQAFQNTLDASKSTSGDIDTQSQSMLTLFQSSAIKLLANPPPSANFTCNYQKAKDVLRVSYEDSRGPKVILCHTNEADVYFDEHDTFLPKRFVNYLLLQSKISNKAFEFLYFNMLRILSEKVTNQQADTMLSINMRYVFDNKTIPLTEKNKDCPRRWVTSHELYAMQDPMLSPLLPDANERFTYHALTGKKYNPNNVFGGVFSLEDIGEIVEKAATWSRNPVALAYQYKADSVNILPEMTEEPPVEFDAVITYMPESIRNLVPDEVEPIEDFDREEEYEVVAYNERAIDVEVTNEF